MKKLKFSFVLILSLLLCIIVSFFTACDFISYKKGMSKDEQEYQEMLSISKIEYIEKLENLSSQDLYYETEIRSYLLCLIEGKNEINDCTSFEEIESVFNKNVEIIKSIKTIADYEEEEYQWQKELQNAKSEYILQLNKVSSVENYREAEQKVFEFYLESGIAAINESTDKNLIEKVYLTYKEVIESIKTAAQYDAEEAVALEEFRESKIAEIENYVDLNIYRVEERELIVSFISEYRDNIAGSSDYIEIDNFVRDFKIKIYPIKTDVEIYAIELENLITASISEIQNYVNLIDYRDNEVKIITASIASFNSQVILLKDKDAVIETVALYKSILDSVKTDSYLYEEEKMVLVDECYHELLAVVDFNSLTEEEVLFFQEYCDNIKTEMAALKTKEAVREKLSQEKKLLVLKGAQANEPNSLKQYKQILISDLTNKYDLSLYREEQVKQIISLRNNGIAEIEAGIDYNAIVEAADKALNALNSVLTNDAMWRKEDEEFKLKLIDLFGEDRVLQEPNSLVKADDYFQLAEIIDYYAFYQTDFNGFVRDKFRVLLNYSHSTAQYEINEVYWYCELIRSAVGITGYFEDNDYLVLELVPYRLASQSNREVTNFVEKYNSLIEYNSDKSKMQARNSTFDDFAYKNNIKKISGIWNTQQLWYALEHEYVPICVAGSVAEKTLNKAKQILREIIMEGMSDEEKVFQIYSWFGKNVQYDHKYGEYLGSSDMDRFPDEQAATLDSFHIEGALFNKLAVCEGYAKSYLLLLRIEGITSYRVFVRHAIMNGKNSINTQKYTGGGYGSHAYVAISLYDDVFFYSDAETSSLSGNAGIQSYHQLMVQPVMLTEYIGGFTFMYPTMKFDDSINEIYRRLSYSGKSLYISSANQAAEVLELLDNNLISLKQISLFCDTKTYENLKDDLMNFDYIEKSASSTQNTFKEFILRQDI